MKIKTDLKIKKYLHASTPDAQSVPLRLAENTVIDGRNVIHGRNPGPHVVYADAAPTLPKRRFSNGSVPGASK